MSFHSEVPELLEVFMDSMEEKERWVTVRELREFFGLDISTGQAFAGFLQKIYQGPFFSCRFKVVRIEKFQDTSPPYRIIRKYLVQVRPQARKKDTLSLTPSLSGSQKQTR